MSAEPEPLRDYSNCPSHVVEHYRSLNTSQTLEYVRAQKAKYGKFDHGEWTIMEALQRLDFIDESDPDVEVGNIFHCYTTAEAARAQYPDEDWLHLVGLIHDLGKLLHQWDEPQWAIGGDTFPVGCAFDEKCVFAEFFDNNPDSQVEEYKTKLGIYEEGCGFDNLHMSWGHDEYLYSVLNNHNHNLPEEALYIIRFHSFYPWHKNGAYEHFASEKDKKRRALLNKFQRLDLYSKTDDQNVDVDALNMYYGGLIEKYIPGKVKW